MATLKCSDCPVIFTGEIISSFEMHKDDPELQKLMDATGCPDCGAAMYPVEEEPGSMTTDNERINLASDIRAESAIRQALYELETQITQTISTITAGVGVGFYSAEQIAQSLTDRELLTLELWAGDEHQAITAEVKRRRDEYEKFVNRFGERA